ncbi:tumor necrosis factor receptor superfamily member 9 [Pelobates fuscus]|uniref:tumor necrosis factor receptor superfamily member 9 n=1 Tax=Pelobates fuscus TaxID=191477 RepID=UPI002FE47FAC
MSFTDNMEKVAWALFIGTALLAITSANVFDNCLERHDGCCTQCLPGFRRTAENCQKCDACPLSSYMDVPNSNINCKRCRSCEGIFQYEKTCTYKSNAVCKCVPGKICADKDCMTCKNIPCKAGQQLIDKKCIDCPYGTFNDGTDKECKAWKSCENSHILLNGSSSSDVVCADLIKTTEKSTTIITTVREVTRKPDDNTVMVIVYIGIVIAVLLFVVVLIVLNQKFLKWVKTMKNKVKKLPVQINTPKEEDACSCHYPEEEQGNALLPEQHLHDTV